MPISTKQWVIDDIFNAALYDLITGDPVAFFEKLKKITITIDAKQQRQYGGTSRFAFHLSEQDSESNVQLENLLFDYNQLAAATGATLGTAGSTVFPKIEKLTAASGGVVTPTKAASMVTDSQRVIVASKSHANAGVLLTKVASAPTSLQYTISSGVITLGDATLVGKDVRVFYDYTESAGKAATLKTTSKNSAYMFKAMGSALDDELNTRFDVAIVIYKCQMLGSFMIDLQRKSATSSSVDLAVLDAGRSDEKVLDILSAS